MLNLPQLKHVETSDPRLADSLRRIVEAVNTLGVGTGVDPAGATESPTPQDLELPINVTSERVAFQWSTNSAGSWFRMRRLVPSLTQDPWAPVRGVN